MTLLSSEPEVGAPGEGDAGDAAQLRARGWCPGRGRETLVTLLSSEPEVGAPGGRRTLVTLLSSEPEVGAPGREEGRW